MFFDHRIRAAVAAAVVSALLVPEVVAAKKPKDPKPTGVRLEGKIVAGPKKAPVAGAVVRVKFLDGAEERASVPSDAKGRFRLEGLPFGYAELIVESSDGRYPADHILELPPRGNLGLNVALQPLAKNPAAWWLAEPAGDAAGVAVGKPVLRGRDFWSSPTGIAIIAGVGAAALLAIASGTKRDPNR